MCILVDEHSKYKVLEMIRVESPFTNPSISVNHMTLYQHLSDRAPVHFNAYLLQSFREPVPIVSDLLDEHCFTEVSSDLPPE
jgi:hypothetical protein